MYMYMIIYSNSPYTKADSLNMDVNLNMFIHMIMM